MYQQKLVRVNRIGPAFKNNKAHTIKVQAFRSFSFRRPYAVTLKFPLLPLCSAVLGTVKVRQRLDNTTSS